MWLQRAHNAGGAGQGGGASGLYPTRHARLVKYASHPTLLTAPGGADRLGSAPGQPCPPSAADTVTERGGTCQTRPDPEPTREVALAVLLCGALLLPPVLVLVLVLLTLLPAGSAAHALPGHAAPAAQLRL